MTIKYAYDKPVLVSVTWAHTIFGFFEIFCKHASRTKLCGKKKSYFLDLRIKSYGCLSFKEKSGQGGHVLEPTSQSWPLAQKVEGRNKKKFKKNGNCPTGAGVDPRLVGDRWLLAASWHLCLWDSSHFFEIFLFKKKEFLEVWVMGQGFWENGCRAPPIFWSLPLHLEVLILPKFIESGNFTFFHNFFLLNLVHTWTFTSTVGIFVSWKI
jgi:hypothetical protein